MSDIKIIEILKYTEIPHGIVVRGYVAEPNPEGSIGAVSRASWHPYLCLGETDAVGKMHGVCAGRVIMEFRSIGQTILSMAFENPCYYPWEHLMQVTLPYDNQVDLLLVAGPGGEPMLIELWHPEWVMN